LENTGSAGLHDQLVRVVRFPVNHAACRANPALSDRVGVPSPNHPSHPEIEALGQERA